MGNTRTCSPGRTRALYSCHSSGRCCLGSHWPNSSRNEKMRSLARAFSSSRRAPPMAASKPYAAMVSSRVMVCRRLREARGPRSSTARPRSIDSCTEPISSRSPSRATVRSRKASTSGKLRPVSICRMGNGNRAGRNAFAARRNRTAESFPPENSSTGRAHSAAVSRRMKMASASSASRSLSGPSATAGSTSAVPRESGLIGIHLPAGARRPSRPDFDNLHRLCTISRDDTIAPAGRCVNRVRRVLTRPAARAGGDDMAGIGWDDVLRKNPRERMKREEHPLDVRQRLPALAAAGYEAVSEEDLVRLQWFGAYHDKPRVGYFMLRVKIPGGLLTPQQCRAIGELAEQFRDYAELTTRQNVQLHWVRLDELGAVLDRLEALGLLPYGGCGDAVRNLTGCPLAGYHPDEPFDATADLLALARFFYDPTQRDYLNLPRKHKITVAACPDHCNYPEIHDIAFVGTVQAGEPGYAVWIGGGLSTNPRLGRDLGVFIRRDEALAVARAILDVWREPPENRLSFTKARIKFFVDKIGPEEYRRRL